MKFSQLLIVLFCSFLFLQCKDKKEDVTEIIEYNSKLKLKSLEWYSIETKKRRLPQEIYECDIYLKPTKMLKPQNIRVWYHGWDEEVDWEGATDEQKEEWIDATWDNIIGLVDFYFYNLPELSHVYGISSEQMANADIDSLELNVRYFKGSEIATGQFLIDGVERVYIQFLYYPYTGACYFSCSSNHYYVLKQNNRSRIYEDNEKAIWEIDGNPCNKDGTNKPGYNCL